MVKVTELEIVQMDTGEVRPAISMIRPRWKGEAYFMGFQEMFERLAKDKELRLESKNVLLYLFSQLDFSNYIHLSQSEIAKQLDMQRGNVSRAISQLVERGILLDGPRIGRSRSYRLNANFGWKGTLRSLKQHRKNEDNELIKSMKENPS